MKIAFFTSNPNDNMGSYRIWVRDLSLSLEEIGHNVKIITLGDEVGDEKYDVLIIGKSAYQQVSEIKSFFPDTVIGAINVAADYYNPDIDFVIVGSVEEYVSLSSYENVFIYPLIERKYENVKIKKHKDQKVIKFGYHGHWPHLAKFSPHLSKAIEECNNSILKCELHIITGEDNPPFPQNAKPDVPTYFYNYSKIDVTDTINKFDIGIVPNVTDIGQYVPGLQDSEMPQLGLYKTDFNLRIKNKTNAGRAYVFYQHGIPVIHDLSPSSFEIMTKTGFNICAHDKNSYLREMKKLSSHKFRNIVASSNKKVFEEFFNPLDHAQKLVNFLKLLQL